VLPLIADLFEADELSYSKVRPFHQRRHDREVAP
jgi:hypothetical protein